MPVILERKKSMHNAVIIDNFLNNEPPLNDDELQQLANSYEDMKNGNMISWEEAKKFLEELP